MDRISREPQLYCFQGAPQCLSCSRAFFFSWASSRQWLCTFRILMPGYFCPKQISSNRQFFASKTCSNMQISLKFIHITLFQTFFSRVFQPCSFQVHDYPAKSLATARGSVCNRPSGHFSFQAK